LATFSKGQGYSKADLRPTGNPAILYGRLYTKYETIINHVDTYAYKKENAVISEGGEVIIPASGETAEDISRASVISIQGIIIGGDLNIIKPNSCLNPVFLALSVSNGCCQKELSKKAQGKSIVHIHNEDISSLNIHFPNIKEQTGIAAQFLTLDNLITLHQRKSA